MWKEGNRVMASEAGQVGAMGGKGLVGAGMKSLGGDRESEEQETGWDTDRENMVADCQTHEQSRVCNNASV